MKVDEALALAKWHPVTGGHLRQAYAWDEDHPHGRRGYWAVQRRRVNEGEGDVVFSVGETVVPRPAKPLDWQPMGMTEERTQRRKKAAFYRGVPRKGR